MKVDLPGWPENLLRALGVLEVADAVGLIAGLFWWPLGVAAAGVTLYFLGAVISYLRVRDAEWQPAVVIGLVSATALVLRILSAWADGRPGRPPAERLRPRTSDQAKAGTAMLTSTPVSVVSRWSVTR